VVHDQEKLEQFGGTPQLFLTARAINNEAITFVAMLVVAGCPYIDRITKYFASDTAPSYSMRKSVFKGCLLFKGCDDR
jgi:hypothetical protein